MLQRQPASHLSPVSCPFFILTGPTAVGKSALAVAVAERCRGEIVGADAFQVYRGLDILTAKPSPELRARVPHHLIGEIPLTQSFDAAQYLAAARQHISEIRNRGRMPIVVGGTGLYLRALTRGLADLPGADSALRAELEKLPLAELQRQLAELDPLGAALIDLQNPRRVIRALEVCKLTARPFSSFREEWSVPNPSIRGVILTLPREVLNARIDQRTAAMFTAGVIEEVRACSTIGPTASQTIGLREIRALLRGETNPSDCLATIQQDTRRYAKRQMTWFRREASLVPCDLSGLDDFRPLSIALAEKASS